MNLFCVRWLAAILFLMSASMAIESRAEALDEGPKDKLSAAIEASYHEFLQAGEAVRQFREHEYDVVDEVATEIAPARGVSGFDSVEGD
jgi:hypothetical protein